MISAGLDGGFANTGFAKVCFEDGVLNADLWTSKPFHDVDVSRSDILRLVNFANWLEACMEEGVKPDVLTIEYFTPHEKHMSWSSIKTVMINAIAIGVAAQMDIPVKYVTPREVHKMVGGPSKEDTEMFVRGIYEYDSKVCKSKQEHVYDAIAIAHYTLIKNPNK